MAATHTSRHHVMPPLEVAINVCAQGRSTGKSNPVRHDVGASYGSSATISTRVSYAGLQQ